jgi:pimeloyl-ACP methyl ester carboxylesterase
MGLIKTAVLEIAVEEEGPAEGRPVLLLRGWPDAPRGWPPLARWLHERGWRNLCRLPDRPTPPNADLTGDFCTSFEKGALAQWVRW